MTTVASEDHVRAFLEVVGATRPDIVAELADPDSGLAVRDWLLQNWQDALDAGDPRPHVVFEAGPGFGKTVAAVQFGVQALRAGRVTAGLLFRAGDFRSADPSSVTEVLAMQLARLVPGFQTELEASRREAVGIPVEVHVGDVSVVTGDVSGAVTGVSVRVEQPQGTAPSRCWDRDLVTPLRNVVGLPPVLIIFDGIDEATAGIRSMIFDGLGSLPQQVQILATTRPPAVLPVTDPVVSLRLRHLTPEDWAVADEALIADWVRLRLLTLIDDAEWVSVFSGRVAAAASGVFLYAYHVTTAIGPLLLADDLPDARDIPLPEGGLPGVYDAYLTRRFGSRESTEWRSWGRSVLGPLAVSRDLGLTAPMIAAVGSLDPLSVQDALDDSGQFVRQDPDSGAWRIWHRSFADYLVESQTYAIAAPYWNERLSATLSPFAATASGVRHADYAVRYAVSNLAEHIARSGDNPAVRSQVTALLGSSTWTAAAVALVGPDRTAALLRRLEPLAQDGRLAALARALGMQAQCLGQDVATQDGQLLSQLSVWAAQTGDSELGSLIDSWAGDSEAAFIRAMWSSSEGANRQRLLTRHPGDLIAAAILPVPEDILIVTAGRDGLVRGWSTVRGEVAFTWREPTASPVITVSCSRVGAETVVLVGSIAATTVLSVSDSGMPEVRWTQADAAVTASLIVDGPVAVTGHANGELKARTLLDGATAGDPPACSGQVTAMATVHPDGASGLLVVASEGSGRCAVWDPVHNVALPELPLGRAVASLAGSGNADGLLAIGTFADSGVVLMQARLEADEIVWREVGSYWLGRTRRSMGESVYAVQVVTGDDGVTVVAGDTAGRVHLLGSDPDRQAPWVAAHAGEIAALLTVPDAGAGFVSVGARDGLLKLWSVSEIADGAWPEQLLCLDFVGPPDSPVAIACGHATGELSLRDVDSGELRCRSNVQNGAIWSLVWAGEDFGLVSGAGGEVMSSVPLGLDGSAELRSSTLLSLSGQVSCVTAHGYGGTLSVAVSTLFSELSVFDDPSEVVEYPPFGGVPLWLRIATVAEQDYLIVEREVGRDMAVISGVAMGRYLQVWPRTPPDTPNPIWRQGWNDPNMLGAWTTALDDGVPVIIEGLRDGAVVLFDLDRIVSDPNREAGYYQRHESWPSRSPVTAVAGAAVDGVLCLAWSTLDGWLYVERARDRPARRVWVGSQVLDLRVGGDGLLVVGSTSGVLALRLV